MLKNPNCYLQMDATAGIVTNVGGVDGDNTYVYVIMAAVPTLGSTPHYYLPFGLFVCSNQGAVNLNTMLGQLLGRLRRFLGGKRPKFHHATADSCPAIRSALAMQLNGCSTMELMKRSSKLLLGLCTIPEALAFTPLHSCLAHQVKSDADYCKKHKVGGIERLLFLRVRAVMQMTTDDK